MSKKCIWLTGLPSSGKTTIAKLLNKMLTNSMVLDGDELRATALGQDVGFSPKDRFKHIQRMGAISKLLVDNGSHAICAFVSPEKNARDKVRELFGDNFLEVHVHADINVCVKRDVKGLYARALRGEIDNMTGLDGIYEAPVNPEIAVNTETETILESVQKILDYVQPFRKPACMFIGRWNGVYHNGHDYIIQSKLDEGKSIIMAVRDIAPDESNPWGATMVKEMLEYRWKDNPDVEIIIIPDVESVEYGRGVGYEVNEIKVDKEIAGISGTELRSLIEVGDDSWKEFVPKEIVKYMEKENG